MLYKDLVQVYEKLNSTSKRLEKTEILAELLKKTSSDELDKVILLLQGRVFHPWESKEMGVAARIVIKAISRATGKSDRAIESQWRRSGDLGDAAQEFMNKVSQHQLFKEDLSISKVVSNLQRLASLEGKGTVDNKLGLLMDLLVSAEAIEAKYIVRTVLETMRVGVGKGIVRDAIFWAFLSEGLDFADGEVPDDKRDVYNDYMNAIQHAYDLTNSFSAVIEIAKREGIAGLKKVEIQPGKPINVMLYIKAQDFEDAFKTVGKPAAFEYKLDGFRLQCHKTDKIRLFTRRLDDVTKQFPDVVENLEKIKAGSFIIDAEAVGFDVQTGKYLPFQSVSQRIKRKFNIQSMAKRFPVELNVFDILELDGRSMLDVPFEKRRAILRKLVTDADKKMVLVKQIVTDNIEKARDFYGDALADGQEGVMAKNLEGIYKPGARVGYGVKIKPVMEPLDLVIVSAEYGEGKRSGWLTSYVTACWDKEKKQLVEIGKVSTGLKEIDEQGLSFGHMTKILKPLVIETSGKIVKVTPKIVIEVAYEEIQKSIKYSSGYALRFPRVLRLREDKPMDQANSLNEIDELFLQQRGRKVL